jgi:hypothetical protein
MPVVVQPRIPPFGTLDALGRKPYVPQHRAGIRTEPTYIHVNVLAEAFFSIFRESYIPPMSVPTPSGDPRRAIREPSPPLEPPGPRALFQGFRQRWKTLLWESVVWNMAL